MDRRSFLKFLAIVPLAPKVAIDVISKIEPVPLIHPKFIYGKVSIKYTDMGFIGKMMAENAAAVINREKLLYDIAYFKGYDVKPSNKR
jgi:hypothetical protein